MAKSHDPLFRGFLSDLRVAKTFCLQFLPPEVQQRLDLDTIKICKTSFVEPTLSEMMSDVILSFEQNELLNSIYIIIEHQSQPDRILPVRILRYAMALIHEHFNNHKRPYLPLVYPVVFYNGQRSPYPEPHSLVELLCEQDRELAQKLLHDNFHMIDLHQIDDAKLRENTWSGLLAFAMKHCKKPDLLFFWNQIVPDLKILSEQANSLLNYFVRYTIMSAEQTKSVTIEELNHFFSTISRQAGEESMTVGEALEARGMEKGVQKGVQQRDCELLEHLMQKQYDVDHIADIMGRSTAEVRALMNSHLRN